MFKTFAKKIGFYGLSYFVVYIVDETDNKIINLLLIVEYFSEILPLQARSNIILNL